MHNYPIDKYSADALVTTGKLTVDGSHLHCCGAWFQ